MFEYMQSAEDTADEIAKLYQKSSGYLSAELDKIFERYKRKHHLTDAEAYRLLNSLHDKTSLEELKEALRAGDGVKKDILAELESPAYRARLERLEQMQNQLDAVMQSVYRQEKKINTSHYVDLANEAYYRSIFDIQQQTGLGFSFDLVDTEVIDRVINSKWSGANYSARIWHNTQALAQDLKEELLVNLVTGRTDREAAEIIANKYAQGASNARRLVRTESCNLANQMEMQSYEECGIEKYRFVATLDLRTSSVCRKLDGKVFPVSEQQPGVNCPPMHPWCRSTTICVIDEMDMSNMKRRARDPVTGKTKTVPADMTYNEWKQVIDGNGDFGAWKANRKESDDQNRYAARRKEWKLRQTKSQIPEITEKKEIKYDFKGKDEKFGKSRGLIDKLSAEYNTHLENVTIGARHAAGAVDMSGTTMHLSSADPAVAIHEFAHSMANSKATQYGVTHDDDFWKEIKAVRRRYRKEAGSDTDRWISSYEHSHKDVDEFFAEAFTQAKMHEMGLELPGKYGTDTTYSQQVLEITNRYFGKMQQEFSPRKVTKGSFGVDWPKVMSPDYRKSLEKLSGDKKVVDAIEVRAKWALSNRNGMKTEELYAVSLDTGKEITSILGQQVESGVKRTKRFIQRLNKADAMKERILLIHNHPQGLHPSISDINALMSNKNVSGITVGHNGSIYYYTKPVKAIPQFDFDVALRRYKEYTDVTGMEKALEYLQKEYGFTIEKL